MPCSRRSGPSSSTGSIRSSCSIRSCPTRSRKIAEIAIGRLAERRGLTQSGVLLDISKPATARLAEDGFSAELGARALRRHLDAAGARAGGTPAREGRHRWPRRHADGPGTGRTAEHAATGLADRRAPRRRRRSSCGGAPPRPAAAWCAARSHSASCAAIPIASSRSRPRSRCATRSASSKARSRPPRARTSNGRTALPGAEIARLTDRARAADRPVGHRAPPRKASCAPPKSCASRRSRRTSTRSI